MKAIEDIYKILTKNKLITIIIILLAILASIIPIYDFFLGDKPKETIIEDSDFIDYKGAINPTTNIDLTQVQNPKPKNELTYEVISINQNIDDTYRSEFRLNITVPNGGWFSPEDIQVNSLLTCEQILPKKGDIINEIGFSPYGQSANFFHVRIACTSQEYIENNGNLFKI